MIRYGTTCSGIESPTQGWEILGWEPVFFSEIEEYASEVLAQRYPEIPNLGDMTAEDFLERINALGGVDVFAGGTPCQGFSLAGLRGSLSDDRSNLCLRFVQLVHGIKSDEKQGVKIAVWENVAGCLSTADNAFGCMLAGLVGEERPLIPCDKDTADRKLVKRYWSLDKKTGEWRCRWPDAGMVIGPKRSAAWRIIDSQGVVPQRRERVFLVSFRTEDGINPSAVLHEPEADPLAYLAGLGGRSLFPVPKGVPGDSEQGEASRETVAALTANGVGASGPDDNQAQAGHLIADRKGFRMVAFGEYADDDTASTMKARDYKDVTDIVVAPVAVDVRHGKIDGQTTQTLQSKKDGGYALNSQPLVLQHKPIGFDCKATACTPHEELAPTMRAMGFDASHANGGGQLAIAVDVRNGLITGDRTPPLMAGAGDGRGISYNCVPLAVVERTRNGEKQAEWQEDLSYCLTNPGDGSRNDSRTVCTTDMIVRRLTPTECERLMGFPDDFTQILWKGKTLENCPDNGRYKCLGNSMVTWVMHWVGVRIEMVRRFHWNLWRADE
jgi:DNA (cytosine-5)-methyltransferase 1